MATEVSESEAAFLDDARRRIARIAEAVLSFGKRSYLDFGSAWGQQFEPLYAEWQELYDQGAYALAPGSEARAAFTREMDALNKTLGHAQNDDEGWMQAVTRFAQNPLAFAWSVGKTFGAAELEGAGKYTGEAGTAALDAAKRAALTSLKNAGDSILGAAKSPWFWAAVLGGGYLLLGRRR